MTPFLLEIHWSVTVLAVLLVMVCVLLTLIILVQKPKGGGLAGAFGGATSSGSVLGAKTGDFLTWTTVGFFVAFVVLSILLIKLGKPATVEQLQTQITEQAKLDLQKQEEEAKLKAATSQPAGTSVPPSAPLSAPGNAPGAVPVAPAAPATSIPATKPATGG